MSESVKIRYRVKTATIEEYVNCELDHWTTNIKYCDTLAESFEEAKRGLDEESSEIILEVFDPSCSVWISILSFGVKAESYVYQPDDES